MTFEEWWKENREQLQHNDKTVPRWAWNEGAKAERERCRKECLKVAGRWTLGENDEWAKAKSYGAEECAAAIGEQEVDSDEPA